MLLTSLLLLPSLQAAQVVLDRSAYEALLPPQAEPEAVPGPGVTRRDVVIAPTSGGLSVVARWQLSGPAPGWVRLVLAPSVMHVETLTFRGQRLDGQATGAGLTVHLFVDSPGELQLEGFVPGDPAQAPVGLPLAAAPVGTVSAPGLHLRDAVAVDGTWWTGRQQLVLGPPPPPPRTGETLVVAHGGLGVTLQEDALHGRARMLWEVRRGAVEQVSFRLTGAGADLEVTGVGLREWTRRGDRVVATLQAPSEGRVALEATWSRPVPRGTEASVPLPILTPEGAFRADVSLQLARDGELEVLPDLPRWEAIPRDALPTWGRDLVHGTPTAAYVAASARPGQLGLLRYEPVEAPAVVVDIAAHTLAASREGRVLGRSLYQVRNERASHLRVALPEGSRLLGVRVGREVATPVSDGTPGVLVPLVRSVETVEGLISFPVEVIWLSEGAAWVPGEVRRQVLPVTDAPVGVARTTVHLPPGFGDGGDEAEDRVDTFSEGEGITYGFAVGDARAVESDQLFQGAVDDWMNNDFDAAQEKLDELDELGAESEDIDRLASNLEIVFATPAAPKEARGDKRAERRIKAQARARSTEKDRVQKKKVAEAEEAERSGDYARAQSLYGEALELGEELEVLADEESVEQSSRNEAYRSNLAQLEEKQAAVEAPEEPGWWDVPATDEEPVFLSLGDADGDDWFDVDEDAPVIIGGQVLSGDVELIGGEVTEGLGGLGTAGRGAGASGYGSGGASFGYAGSVHHGAAAAPEPLPAPSVIATALTVHIPTAGEAVHFQRLLLPAGATTEVVLVGEQERVRWRSR